MGDGVGLGGPLVLSASGKWTYSFLGKSEGGGFHWVKKQKHVTQRQYAGEVFGKSRFGGSEGEDSCVLFVIFLPVSDSKVASAAYMRQISTALVYFELHVSN